MAARTAGLVLALLVALAAPALGFSGAVRRLPALSGAWALPGERVPVRRARSQAARWGPGPATASRPPPAACPRWPSTLCSSRAAPPAASACRWVCPALPTCRGPEGGAARRDLCAQVGGTGQGAGKQPIWTTPQVHSVSGLMTQGNQGDLDFPSGGDGRWNINWAFVACPGGSTPATSSGSGQVCLHPARRFRAAATSLRVLCCLHGQPWVRADRLLCAAATDRGEPQPESGARLSCDPIAQDPVRRWVAEARDRGRQLQPDLDQLRLTQVLWVDQLQCTDGHCAGLFSSG